MMILTLFQVRQFKSENPWLATKRTKIFAESEIGLWHGVSACNSSDIAGVSLLCYWLLFSLLRAHSAQLSSVHSTLKIVPTRPWLTGPWNGRSLLSFSQSCIFQVLKLWYFEKANLEHYWKNTVLLLWQQHSTLASLLETSKKGNTANFCHM